MSAKKPPYRSKQNVRGHETPRPFVPVLSPRAAAARARALSFLAAGNLSPFRDYRAVRNGAGPWWGH
jgi:hypothetical protein